MKTNRLHRLRCLLWALPLLMLAGCDQEELGGEEPGGKTGTSEITFEIGFAPQAQMQNAQAGDGNAPLTRAATDPGFATTWEDGDEIGLFAVRHASDVTGTLTPTGNYIHNVKLTYNGSTWTSATTLYFPPGTDQLDFYAYYPYDSNGGSPTTLNPAAIAFTVKTDQSASPAGKSNYNASDLLIASPKTNVARSTAAVALTFRHALALVEVEVPAGTMKGSGPDATLVVSLRSVKPSATLDLSAAEGSEVSLATANNAPINIKMARVESNPLTATTYTYRALVPAQTAAKGANLFFFEQNNKLFSSSALATALVMTAGEAKRYAQTLPFTIQTVFIPKGTFLMGSSDGSGVPEGLNTTPKEPNRSNNETQHQVTLTKDFYMSKYQITNAQYAAFLNAKPADGLLQFGNTTGTFSFNNAGYFVDTEPLVLDCTTDSRSAWGVKRDVGGTWASVPGYENHPVIYVTWFGAKAFADWVGGTLPTEAQWEYACRAGTTTAYSYGDTADAAYMWYSGSSQTQIVGTKNVNLWGLYDMHGNVFEWCSDWYAVDYGSANASDSAVDPTGPTTSGNYRVIRGGSWNLNAQYCRSAYRSGSTPGSAGDLIGFRVVFPH